MVASKEIKCLEKSRVELSVKVDKEFVKKEYDELLAKYSKTAHIKGFRPGKVPASVLERKFGDSLVNEAGFNVIEKSLQEALLDVEKKPLPYVTPALKDEENLKLALDKDIEYTVEYDTFPEVELGEYKGIEIEVPNVVIKDSDIDRELDKYREQNAIVTEKKGTNGKVAKDNVITINYVEVDADDKEVTGTKRDDFTFTVGTGYNYYKLDDDVIGMKKEEEKIIEKEYAPDFEYKDLAGRKVRIKVKVTSIKKKELPEITDELAQDINEKFKTKEDLIEDVKKRLDGVTDMKLTDDKKRAIMEKIIESTKVDPPQAMIDNQINTMWTNFIYRFGGDEKQVEKMLAMEGKTKDDLAKDCEGEALRAVKSQIIIAQISKAEKIEATEADIEEEIKTEAGRSGMKVEEFKEYVKENNMNEYFKIGIIDRKTYDFLIKNAKIKKGAEIKYLDFLHKA